MSRTNEIRTLFANVVTDLKFENVELYEKICEDKGIKKFLKDEELLKTLCALFDNDLNIAKTSKAIFMHRNTLLYRIAKTKRLTGLNPKIFNDAIALKIFLMLNKKFEETNKKF